MGDHMTLADLLRQSMSGCPDFDECAQCAAQTTLDQMTPLLLEVAQRAVEVVVYGESMEDLREVLEREVM